MRKRICAIVLTLGMLVSQIPGVAVSAASTAGQGGTEAALDAAAAVKVSWKKVTGATGYYIYRNNKQVGKVTSGATVTYTDKKATANGAKYVYKVAAYAGTDSSTLSMSVNIYRLARPAKKAVTVKK